MEAAVSPPPSNGPAKKKRVSRRLPEGSNPAKALKTSAAGKNGKSKKSSTSSSGRSSTQVDDEGEEENQEEDEEALHKHARRTLPDFTKTPLLNLDFALKKECAICRQKFAGAFTDFLVYGHPKCVRSRVTNTYYLGQEGEANLPPEMLRVQYTGWQPYSKQTYDYMCVWEHRHPCVLPRNTLEHVEACYIPYREHMERVAAAEREAKEAERQAKLRRADLEARRAKARDARVQRVFTDVSALMQARRSADEGPAEREDQQHGDYDLPSFKKLLARRRATARLLLGDASEDRITCKAKHAVSAANVKSYFILLEHRGGPTPEARSQFEQDFDNFALYHEAGTNMHTAWDYAAMEAKFLAWLVDRRKKQATNAAGKEAKSKKSQREKITERNHHDRKFWFQLSPELLNE
eukprot:g1775.t1